MEATSVQYGSKSKRPDTSLIIGIQTRTKPPGKTRGHHGLLDEILLDVFSIGELAAQSPLPIPTGLSGPVLHVTNQGPLPVRTEAIPHPNGSVTALFPSSAEPIHSRNTMGMGDGYMGALGHR